MAKRSEHQEQVCFFQWLQMQFPAIYESTFAIPNGGSRHPLEAKNLKAEGVKAGVPDLFCAWPWNGYHGLFIEMKAIGGKTSKEQEIWLKRLKSNGFKTSVCYGFDEAKAEIKEYLK